MNEIELKPCPFCGGKAVLIAEINEPDEIPRFWHVSCDNGCVSSWTTGVKQRVIDKWNTRDREAVLVAALEAIVNTKPSLPIRLNSASAMRMYERHCDAVNFANEALEQYRGER